MLPGIEHILGTVMTPCISWRKGAPFCVPEIRVVYRLRFLARPIEILRNPLVVSSLVTAARIYSPIVVNIFRVVCDTYIEGIKYFVFRFCMLSTIAGRTAAMAFTLGNAIMSPISLAMNLPVPSWMKEYTRCAF